MPSVSLMSTADPYQAWLGLPAPWRDGLVEERGGDIEDNIENVARRLAAHPPGLPLEALLRSLVGAVTTLEAEDDTVLLALRIPHL